MPRSKEDLEAALDDPECVGDARTSVMDEYLALLAAEAEPPPPEDPPPPIPIRDGRVLIKGVVSGSILSIERLLTDHLGMLLGSDAPLRLNDLTNSIEHAGQVYDVAELVTRIRVATEERVCVETQKLDPEGRPVRVMLRLPAEDTKAVVISLAKANHYSPVQEWLESLPPVEPGAIAMAAAEALGVTDPLSTLLWRKWLIGCVARALVPGCQLDTVLVLVAPGGGERKSSMFRALVGEWFSDTHLDMIGFKRENAYMQLHRVWIYEVPELDAAKDKAERSRVKSFISTRSDDFRRPYDANVAAHPRAVALGATTNSLDFMSPDDPAYNRRFWPIRIRGKIDTDIIEQLRAQIWAEALAAYRAGEPWHLDDTRAAEVALLADRQLDLAPEDAWTGPIAAYLEAPVREDKALRLLDVMQGALGLEKRHCGMTEQRRVAAVLCTLGWAQRRVRWRVCENPGVRWVGPVLPLDAARAPLDEDHGAHPKTK